MQPLPNDIAPIYIARVWPLFKAGISLVLVAVLLNLVLTLLTSWFPEWLPHRMAGSGFRKDIEQRVTAASQQLASKPTESKERLCALIGLSSFREAVDLKLLSQSDDIECRYLGLCGAGADLKAMESLATPLLESSLRPDLVIFGVNEFLIAGLSSVVPEKTDIPNASQSDVVRVDAMTAGSTLSFVRGHAKNLSKWIWLRERRKDLSMAINDGLTRFNEFMVFHIGSSKSTIRVSNSDPWREMLRLELAEHVDDWNRNKQISTYRKLGRFDPDTYVQPIAEDQIQLLLRLIADFSQMNVGVLIVLMPEISDLRQLIPDISIQRIQSSIDQKFGEGSIQVVNLRDVIDDDAFADIVHVNQSGRNKFTKKLAEIVSNHFRTLK